MTQNVYYSRFALRATVAGAVAAALMVCTDPAYVEAPEAPQTPYVSGLRAELVGGSIHVQWQRPTGVFRWYRLYRTTAIDSLGRPDSATLSTAPIRSHIDPSETEFWDMPGLASSVYHYGITTMAMDGSDTVEGPLSPAWPQLAACTVGIATRFEINHGATATTSRVCTLSITDPYRMCLAVQFTQAAREMRDSGGVLVPYVEPTYGPYALDGDNQVRDLARAGFPRAVASGPPPTVVCLPDFDGADPLNANAIHGLGARSDNVWTWVLPRRYGHRQVFARLTQRIAGGDTVVDTLSAFIRTCGPSIRVDLDPMDKTAGPRSTLTFPPGLYDVVRGDTISFRVVADSGWTGSIGPAFHVWLVTSQKYATLNPDDYANPGKGWYMTRPARFSLPGPSGHHDTNAVYAVPLDTTGPDGRGTFDTLLYGYGTTIAGTRTASHVQNRRLFDTLMLSAVDTYGAKELLVVARFTDTAFADTLLAFGCATEFRAPDEPVGVAVFRDVCPPAIRMDLSAQNPYHLAAGATVRGPFSFALATESIVDLGGEDISQARLVLARKPDSLPWTSATPASLTLDRMRPWLHGSFPIEIAPPDDTIRGVRWDDVDPSAWPYGDYIIGVVVATQNGDSAFAHVKGSQQSNPWLISYQP